MVIALKYEVGTGAVNSCGGKNRGLPGWLGSLLTLATWASLAALGPILSGCSEKQSKQKDVVNENPYAGWATFRSGNIKILYTPGHPQESEFEALARHYASALNTVTESLQMTPYNDTLFIIYYTGWGQGREMTGHEYPFGTDTAIHIWLPSFPGPTLMQHLLPRWSLREPKHRFLKHGLISLYDFSGQNYHHSSILYLDDDNFIPLEELAVDTSIDSNTERHQSAEAASFCAFILAQVGAPGLKELYESNLPFDETIQNSLGITVDSLEGLWLRFARSYVPPEPSGESTVDK